MIYPPEIQEFLEKYDRLLLDERGIIKLQSADFYKTIDDADLRVWCICRAIYQLPTIELVEWLKNNFNLDRAIEIGAGNNYLYHHLEIKGIDAGHKYAPDEEEILNTGVTYIHIGNEDIHCDCEASRRHRLIMNKPHKTYYFDWLVSRGYYPEKNCIYVWSV